LPALEREFEVRITPEDGAMLCALYSRSAESSRTHLRQVAQAGSAKFMSRYYSGYAHKSIADCGSTTLFVERVSVLAAKAIEDTPMFSGQETSTRYMPFDEAPIWEPTGHADAARSLEMLMAFYRELEAPILEHVAQLFPKKDEEKTSDWEGAVRARGFDVRRAFLPAGVATQVGWHGNLRQLADHLIVLRHHPFEEARLLANRMWAALREDFAASFPEDAAMLDVSGERAKGRIGAVEAFREKAALWMWGDLMPGAEDVDEGFNVLRDSIDLGGISDLECELLSDRPRGAGLPHGFGEFGQATFQALVDFGSYRDLHRQRRGFWRMPVLTAKLGFERWYVEQLPETLRPRAEKIFRDAASLWSAVSAARGPVESQHMLPMGYRVPWRYTCGLPQVLYVAELRTPKTVHATARRVAQGMADYVRRRWPWLALHVDMEPDDWTVRRGNQTIVRKDPPET
jgi:thymidylate synthase ThyX